MRKMLSRFFGYSSLRSLPAEDTSTRLLDCKTAYRYMMHIEELRTDPTLTDAIFRQRCGRHLRPALQSMGAAFQDDDWMRQTETQLKTLGDFREIRNGAADILAAKLMVLLYGMLPLNDVTTNYDGHINRDGSSTVVMHPPLPAEKHLLLIDSSIEARFIPSDTILQIAFVLAGQTLMYIGNFLSVNRTTAFAAKLFCNLPTGEFIVRFGYIRGNG